MSPPPSTIAAVREQSKASSTPPLPQGNQALGPGGNSLEGGKEEHKTTAQTPTPPKRTGLSPYWQRKLAEEDSSSGSRTAREKASRRVSQEGSVVNTDVSLRFDESERVSTNHSLANGIPSAPRELIEAIQTAIDRANAIDATAYEELQSNSDATRLFALRRCYHSRLELLGLITAMKTSNAAKTSTFARKYTESALRSSLGPYDSALDALKPQESVKEVCVALLHSVGRKFLHACARCVPCSFVSPSLPNSQMLTNLKRSRRRACCHLLTVVFAIDMVVSAVFYPNTGNSALTVYSWNLLQYTSGSLSLLRSWRLVSWLSLRMMCCLKYLCAQFLLSHAPHWLLRHSFGRGSIGFARLVAALILLHQPLLIPFPPLEMAPLTFANLEQQVTAALFAFGANLSFLLFLGFSEPSDYPWASTLIIGSLLMQVRSGHVSTLLPSTHCSCAPYNCVASVCFVLRRCHFNSR